MIKCSLAELFVWAFVFKLHGDCRERSNWRPFCNSQPTRRIYTRINMHFVRTHLFLSAPYNSHVTARYRKSQGDQHEDGALRTILPNEWAVLVSSWQYGSVRVREGVCVAMADSIHPCNLKWFTSSRRGCEYFCVFLPLLWSDIQMVLVKGKHQCLWVGYDKPARSFV